MSIKNELASNNVDLQNVLNMVNSIEVQENLDSELSTQDNLISQIASALEGKTASGGSGVCELILKYASSGTYYIVRYFDENGASKSTSAASTIKAIGGILYFATYESLSSDMEYTQL